MTMVLLSFSNVPGQHRIPVSLLSLYMPVVHNEFVTATNMTSTGGVGYVNGSWVCICSSVMEEWQFRSHLLWF